MAGRRRDQYDWSKHPEDDLRVIGLYEAGATLACTAAGMGLQRGKMFSRQMIAGRLKRLVLAGRTTRRGDIHPNFINRKAPPPRPKKAKEPKIVKKNAVPPPVYGPQPHRRDQPVLTPASTHTGVHRSGTGDMVARDPRGLTRQKTPDDAVFTTPRLNVDTLIQRTIDRETESRQATFKPRFKSEPCCYPVRPKAPRGWYMCDEPTVPGRSPYCQEHMDLSWNKDWKTKPRDQEQRA